MFCQPFLTFGSSPKSISKKRSYILFCFCCHDRVGSSSSAFPCFFLGLFLWARLLSLIFQPDAYVWGVHDCSCLLLSALALASWFNYFCISLCHVCLWLLLASLFSPPWVSCTVDAVGVLHCWCISAFSCYCCLMCVLLLSLLAPLSAMKGCVCAHWFVLWQSDRYLPAKTSRITGWGDWWP